MSGRDSEDNRRAQLLSRALRAVRDIRPASSRDLAKALGLSLRGYQHFEAGGGQLNVAHVMNFGQAMDCDPIGVLTAVHIGHPEFAAHVAQNKAMIALMIALQEFVEETGPAIARLETSTFVSAYREMFKGLSAKALAAQAENEALMSRAAGRPGVGGTARSDPVGPGDGDPGARAPAAAARQDSDPDDPPET